MLHEIPYILLGDWVFDIGRGGFWKPDSSDEARHFLCRGIEHIQDQRESLKSSIVTQCSGLYHRNGCF
jgi:hypothetical protein